MVGYQSKSLIQKNVDDLLKSWSESAQSSGKFYQSNDPNKSILDIKKKEAVKLFSNHLFLYLESKLYSYTFTMTLAFSTIEIFLILILNCNIKNMILQGLMNF